MPLRHSDVPTGRDHEGRRPKGKKTRPQLHDIITWQEEASMEQPQRPGGGGSGSGGWLASSIQLGVDVSTFGMWFLQGMPQESDPSKALKEEILTKRQNSPASLARRSGRRSRGTTLEGEGSGSGSGRSRPLHFGHVENDVADTIEEIQLLLARERLRRIRTEQFLGSLDDDKDAGGASDHADAEYGSPKGGQASGMRGDRGREAGGEGVGDAGGVGGEFFSPRTSPRTPRRGVNLAPLRIAVDDDVGEGEAEGGFGRKMGVDAGRRSSPKVEGNLARPPGRRSKLGSESDSPSNGGTPSKRSGKGAVMLGGGAHDHGDDRQHKQQQQHHHHHHQSSSSGHADDAAFVGGGSRQGHKSRLLDVSTDEDTSQSRSSKRKAAAEGLGKRARGGREGDRGGGGRGGGFEGGTTREEKRSLQSKIRHRRYEDVITMLDTGISTEVRDEFGNTTLMLAAQAGSKRMCKILMRHGADLNARNSRGQTALHFCYSFRYIELGDYLRAKGADDMILNDHGLTCYEGLDKPAPPASPGDRSVLFSDPLEIPRTPPSGIAGGATAKGAAAAGKAFDSVDHGARGGAFGAAEGGGDEGLLSGEGAASGGSTSKKVEIETSEYQRLKALVEPVNGSVKVLGDKVLLDRVEFDRLTAEAEKAKLNFTPREHEDKHEVARFFPGGVGTGGAAPGKAGGKGKTMMKSPAMRRPRRGPRRTPIMLETVPGSPAIGTLQEGEEEVEEEEEEDVDTITTGSSVGSFFGVSTHDVIENVSELSEEEGYEEDGGGGGHDDVSKVLFLDAEDGDAGGMREADAVIDGGVGMGGGEGAHEHIVQSSRPNPVTLNNGVAIDAAAAAAAVASQAEFQAVNANGEKDDDDDDGPDVEFEDAEFGGDESGQVWGDWIDPPLAYPSDHGPQPAVYESEDGGGEVRTPLMYGQGTVATQQVMSSQESLESAMPSVMPIQGEATGGSLAAGGHKAPGLASESGGMEIDPFSLTPGSAARVLGGGVSNNSHSTLNPAPPPSNDGLPTLFAPHPPLHPPPRTATLALPLRGSEGDVPNAGAQAGTSRSIHTRAAACNAEDGAESMTGGPGVANRKVPALPIKPVEGHPGAEVSEDSTQEQQQQQRAGGDLMTPRTKARQQIVALNGVPPSPRSDAAPAGSLTPRTQSTPSKDSSHRLQHVAGAGPVSSPPRTQSTPPSTPPRNRRPSETGPTPSPRSQSSESQPGSGPLQSTLTGLGAPPLPRSPLKQLHSGAFFGDYPPPPPQSPMKPHYTPGHIPEPNPPPGVVTPRNRAPPMEPHPPPGVAPSPEKGSAPSPNPPPLPLPPRSIDSEASGGVSVELGGSGPSNAQQEGVPVPPVSMDLARDCAGSGLGGVSQVSVLPGEDGLGSHVTHARLHSSAAHAGVYAPGEPPPLPASASQGGGGMGLVALGMPSPLPAPPPPAILSTSVDGGGGGGGGGGGVGFGVQRAPPPPPPANASHGGCGVGLDAPVVPDPPPGEWQDAPRHDISSDSDTPDDESDS